MCYDDYSVLYCPCAWKFTECIQKLHRHFRVYVLQIIVHNTKSSNCYLLYHIFFTSVSNSDIQLIMIKFHSCLIFTMVLVDCIHCHSVVLSEVFLFCVRKQLRVCFYFVRVSTSSSLICGGIGYYIMPNVIDSLCMLYQILDCYIRRLLPSIICYSYTRSLLHL